MAWPAPVSSSGADSLGLSAHTSGSINELAHRFKSNVQSPEDGVSSNYLAVLQRENEKVRAEEAAQTAAEDSTGTSKRKSGPQFTPSALPQGAPISNNGHSGSNSNSNSGRSDSLGGHARSATLPLLVCRDAVGSSSHADRPWLEGLEDGGPNGGRRGSVLTAPADALNSIGKSIGKALRGTLNPDEKATSSKGSAFRGFSSGASLNSQRRVEQLRQRLLVVKQDMKREMHSTADAAATLARRAAVDSEVRAEELNRLTAWGLGVCVPDVSMAWDLRLLRLQLLREGSALALGLLADRRNKAAQLAETSLASDELVRLAGDPSECGVLCQTAAELLAGDAALQALTKRIGYATRALRAALQRAEQHSPRLEPKSRTHRVAMLLEVIDKHQELEVHRKRLFDGAKVECDHALRCSGLLGLDGSKGAKDEHRRRKIERKFLELAADQRTREGRLLSRWCDMTNANVLRYESNSITPTANAGATGDRRGSGVVIGGVIGDRRGSGIIIGGRSSIDEQRQRGLIGGQTVPPTVAQQHTVSSDVNGASPATAAATSGNGEAPESDTQLHPRSLLAFCDYWADAVLNDSLELDAAPGTPRGEALMELSTALVFRTIHPTVFAFVHKAAGSKERDRLWRRKARRMRSLSAIDAGVPPEYLRSSMKSSQQVSTSPAQTPQILNTNGSSSSNNSGSSNNGASGPELDKGALSSARVRAESDFSCSESVQLSMETSSGASAHLSREVTAESTSASKAMGETFTSTAEAPDLAGGREHGTGDRRIAGAKTLKVHSVPSSTLPAVDIRRGLMGIDFWRTARVFSRLTGCVVPWEALHWFMAGMRMLHAEAKLIPGSKPLNADTMFPILTWALVHAELPRLHSVLFFLRHFGLSAFVAAEEAAGRSGNAAGEVDYYLTCTEAAVSHVLGLDVGAEAEASCAGADSDEEIEDALDDDLGIRAVTTTSSDAELDEIAHGSAAAYANNSASHNGTNGSTNNSVKSIHDDEIDSEICAEARKLLEQEQFKCTGDESSSGLRRSVPCIDIRNAVDASTLGYVSANRAPLPPNQGTATHPTGQNQSAGGPHLLPPHAPVMPSSVESNSNGGGGGSSNSNSNDGYPEKSSGFQKIANGFLGIFATTNGAAAEGSKSKTSISTAGSASAAADEPSADPAMDEDSAMEKLGSWLGAQQAMEDTIDVLEQEGWMA